MFPGSRVPNCQGPEDVPLQVGTLASDPRDQSAGFKVAPNPLCGCWITARARWCAKPELLLADNEGAELYVAQMAGVVTLCCGCHWARGPVSYCGGSGCLCPSGKGVPAEQRARLPVLVTHCGQDLARSWLHQLGCPRRRKAELWGGTRQWGRRVCRGLAPSRPCTRRESSGPEAVGGASGRCARPLPLLLLPLRQQWGRQPGDALFRPCHSS